MNLANRSASADTDATNRGASRGRGGYKDPYTFWNNIVFIWSQHDGGNVEQRYNGKGSLQNLMMPKLNKWAETSPNPSAKLILQLCI